MRALIIGQFIEPPFSEGNANVILNWSKALMQTNVDIKVLSTSSKYSGRHEIQGVDFEYLKTSAQPYSRFPTNLAGIIALQRETIRQSRQFDVIHFASGADGLLYSPMLTTLKNYKRKLVNSHNASAALGQHADAISTRFVRSFDITTVLSERMYNVFLQKRVPRRKMRILRPSVDTEKFKPRNKFRIREALGLAEDSFIVFTAGNFRLGRRIVHLIRLLGELAPAHREIVLLIGWNGFGEDDCLKEISAIVKKSSFGKIIPPTSHINLYYNVADVYILNSSSNYVMETPLSIIEALSSGIPVITFDVNACSEIVDDQVNGYVVRDGNFSELKSKLVHLMSSPQVLKGFGAKARNSVMGKFSSQVVGEQLSGFYREATESK